jgi:Kae1-associated kinase Bud32
MSALVKFKETTGAEALIKLAEWRGKIAVSKTRVPKAYRNVGLDKMLRSRRTKEEATLLHAAKHSGVHVPEIYFVDPGSSEILMEYVGGILLKDIQSAKLESLVYSSVGESAARLHASGIIHGDLTPKNIIRVDDKTLIIDFGLSFVSSRLEDRAEDLHLLKQSIRSSETRSAGRRFRDVLQGYESVSGKRELVRITRQIAEIERRGRYARVD